MGSLALVIAATIAAGAAADDRSPSSGRFRLGDLNAPLSQEKETQRDRQTATTQPQRQRTRNSLSRLITNPFRSRQSFLNPGEKSTDAGPQLSTGTKPAPTVVADRKPLPAEPLLIKPVSATPPPAKPAIALPLTDEQSGTPGQDKDQEESSLYGDVTNDNQDLSPSALLRRDLTQIQPTLDFALDGIDRTTLPEDFETQFDHGMYVETRPAPIIYQWAPTNFYHYPLYFEDPALERYGHTQPKIYQPFVSSGRFVAQTIFLPYQMTLKPVYCREYSLGWYRPGECAPKLHYQPVYNNEAAFVQTLSFVTLFLVFP